MTATELIAKLQSLPPDTEVVIGYESIVRVPDEFEVTRGFRFRGKGSAERIELEDTSDPSSLERRHAAWVADEYPYSVDPIRVFAILVES